MTTGGVNYKVLDANCKIEVRALSSERTDGRLITSYRRRERPKTGFVVRSETSFPVGALVELYIEFPGQENTYRSRGLVNWSEKSGRPEGGFKLGILIFGLEKLDGGAYSAPVKSQPVPVIPKGSEHTAAEQQQATLSAQQDVAAAATAAMTAMGPVTQPPTAEEVAELLTSLVGDEVSVQLLDKDRLDLGDGFSIGEYVSEAGTLSALGVMDLSLSNMLGAALAMMPVESVEQDIRAEQMTDEVRDNIQEIFNIGARLFNKTDMPEHRFDNLKVSTAPSEGASNLYESTLLRADFAVDVPGYGSGRWSFAVQGPNHGAPAQTQPTVEQDSDKHNSDEVITWPKESVIAELITRLTGDEIGATVVNADSLAPEDIYIIGDYITEDDALSVVFAMDISLASWLGSALAMIPLEEAESAISAQELSSEVQENVQAILNAAAATLKDIGRGPHRFKSLHLVQKDPAPSDIDKTISKPFSRIDFELSVPDYGKGNLAILATQREVYDSDNPSPTSVGPPDSIKTQHQTSETTEPSASNPVIQEATPHLPTAQALAELLTNLAGDPVNVAVLTDRTLSGDKTAVLASFESDEGVLQGAGLMDIDLPNWLGATLATIPAEEAQKEIQAGNISDDVVESIKEIFNISASLLNQPSGVHSKFANIYLPGDSTQPDEITALIANPESRIDFDVNVPGYGSGILAFCVPSQSVANNADHSPSPTSEAPAEPVATADNDVANSSMSLPVINEVGAMLTNLIGEDVGIEQLEGSETLTPDKMIGLGAFVDDQESIRIVCAVDIELASWLSAALVMIPPESAQADLEAGSFNDETKENLQETFNISTNTLNQANGPQVRMNSFHTVSEGLPEPVQALVESPNQQVTFMAEIPGYGKGKLTYIT